MNKNRNLLWNLFVELRKEILVAQETRAKIIGFKITFLSAGIGLIIANAEKVDSNLLIIPAIAAVFFDLLINSYSISTKRIGHYCRKYLEPAFIAPERIPTGFMLWESYVNQKKVKQWFSMFGNLGISFIIVAATIINGLLSLVLWQGVLLTVFLLSLFGVDAYAHVYPTRKLRKLEDAEIDFTSLFTNDDP